MPYHKQISRRGLLAGTAGALAVATTPVRRAAAQAGRPNIVFIMADDLGYADVSCYGRRDYATPNVDRIAAGGIRFLQGYANSSVCTATRTALITGRYQYRLPIGLEEPLASRSTRAVGLPPAHPTLPSLLKTAGYGTTLIGKWHLGRLPNFGPLQSGYDRFYGFRGGSLDYYTHKFGPPDTDTEDLWDGDIKVHQTGYLTDLLGDRAVSEIDRHAKVGQPFLISLHFNAPHWPWEAPGDEAEAQRLTSLFHFDGGSQKTYARMVMQLDLQVGRVLQALDANGIADNTIVIFTSDNGGERFADTWPFTGRKTELLEGGLRIPAIVRWPGHIPTGSTNDQVMISMDWMPTLLAAAGATPDPAYPLDGISLVPTLTVGAPPVSRTLYWRYRHHMQRAMRNGDWKWLKINGNTFLFNVVDDPLERANLKNRRKDLFERMEAQYAAWEATMLPEDPQANSSVFNGAELADHFGIPAELPVPRRNP
jgi:arylsulfatase A-like enzyme